MTPRFTVVVPTYRRPRSLQRCLSALAAGEAPDGGFEVIVVDDGGDVPLERVVEPFADRLDVSLIRQDNAGPAAARNTGAAKASGEILAFTDDDCAPAPHWLTNLDAAVQQAPGAMVAGRAVNARPDDPYATASEAIVDHLAAWSRSHAAVVPFAASNNLAVPAAAFERLGGFDTRFATAAGEDRDFSARWAASGAPIVWAPDAIVAHAHGHDGNLVTFIRQHAGYGRGGQQFRRTRRERHEDVSVFKGMGFYTALLQRAWRDGGMRVVALVVLAQIATAAGYAAGFAAQRREHRS